MSRKTIIFSDCHLRSASARILRRSRGHLCRGRRAGPHFHSYPFPIVQKRWLKHSSRVEYISGYLSNISCTVVSTVILTSTWIIMRVFIEFHGSQSYCRNLPTVSAVRVVCKIKHEPSLVFPMKFYSFVLV